MRKNGEYTGLFTQRATFAPLAACPPVPAKDEVSNHEKRMDVVQLLARFQQRLFPEARTNLLSKEYMQTKTKADRGYQNAFIRKCLMTASVRFL